MPVAEDYLRYAAECVALAQRTDNPETKARLLQMAQAWRELATKVSGSEPASET
jgi:hypothetical protein